jgi:hypothetical protein
MQYLGGIAVKTALFHILCLTVMIAIFGFTPASGETYLQDWTFGGPDLDASNAVAMDADGNVYIAGSFAGTVDFGGGDRTAVGGNDIYVVKFDRDGNYLWDYTRGSASANDVAYGVEIDSYGNVLVCGSFEESVDFGGGSRTSAGGIDIFVLKLDSSSAWVWDRTFGNRNNQAALAVGVDGDDNVIVTGRFRQPINFGGGRRPPVGRRDMFLVKLDAAGSYVWDRTFGGEGRDAGRRIAIDAANNIFVAGNFEYAIDFGGGERVEGNTAFYDGYLVKLDPDGNYLADDTWGGAGEDAPWGIALCSDGGVCVTGYFEQVVDFGGGNRYAIGSWDICVLRYGSNCNYLWDATWGGAGEDFGSDVSILTDDHIFVSGSFENIVDFGGGERHSAGDKDVFLLEIDCDGEYLWDDTHGGIGRERADGLVTDLFEGMFLTGSFAETVDFGGGDRTSNGLTDVFVVKYDVPVPATADIHPKTLNFKSRGRWITCYIELPEGFDIADIDIASVRLDGVVSAVPWPIGIGDEDEDGVPDLMVKFNRSNIMSIYAPDDNICLSVTGIVGDQEFEGTDCIRGISPPQYPVDDGDMEESPRAVSLGAHPNPFNPTVRIVYSVPASGRVLIQVWDISGRLVRTLENRQMAAGTYRTEWNGMNDSGAAVASGVYFCRLSVGGRFATQKLMLLR